MSKGYHSQKHLNLKLCLVLEFSRATVVKCMKESVADPWLTLITQQQEGMVRPALCSLQQ